MLLSPTVSRSMSVMRPTPVRARASAHQEPTPPRPNTATWLFFSFSMASAPKSISARTVLSCIAFSFLPMAHYHKCSNTNTVGADALGGPALKSLKYELAPANA